MYLCVGGKYLVVYNPTSYPRGSTWKAAGLVKAGWLSLSALGQRKTPILTEVFHLLVFGILSIREC